MQKFSQIFRVPVLSILLLIVSGALLFVACGEVSSPTAELTTPPTQAPQLASTATATATLPPTPSPVPEPVRPILHPIVVDEQWGLIDDTGEVQLDPQFDTVVLQLSSMHDFARGPALGERDGEWVLFDESGTTLHELPTPDFDPYLIVWQGEPQAQVCAQQDPAGGAPGWAETTQVVMTVQEETTLFFVCNGAMESVVVEQYAESLFLFTEGLSPASLKDESLWGYIDDTGEFVIEPQFLAAEAFESGRALVVQEDVARRFIDRNGEYAFDESFVDARSFGEGLAPAAKIVDETEDDRLWGYIDTSGEWVVEPQFTSARPFLNGYAEVAIDRLGGLIDPTGAIVVPLEWERIYTPYQGLAVATSDGQWGYVNTQGEIVIELQFRDARDFAEDRAAVRAENSWGFIDLSGELVIAPEWDEVRDFAGGLAWVSSGDGWGYVNPDGGVVWWSERP